MKVLACDGIDSVAVKRIRDAGHDVVEAKGLAAPDLITALMRSGAARPLASTTS